MLAHDGIGLGGVYGDKVGFEGLLHNLALFYLEVHLAVGHKAAVAAGVQERRGVTGFHIGPVVVAADEPVHALYQIEGIEGLGFQDGAVSLAAGRVHGSHHYVRVFPLTHVVHVLLDAGSDGLEVHAAPEFFREPGLDVGVVVTQHSNAKAGLLYHPVGREVGLAIVVTDGIGSQEGRAGMDQAFLYAVVHGVTGLNVMVTHGNGVVTHVLNEPGEEVRGYRVYIIIIVGGVVTLQAVAGVYEQHVVKAIGRADAVNVVVHGEEGLFDIPAGIGRVKPGAVHVVGRKDSEGVLTILQPVSAASEKDEGHGRKGKKTGIHSQN